MTETSDKANQVVQHMGESVQKMKDAAQSAEALLNKTSEHILSITDKVDSDDSDAVDEALNQLESFANALNDQAAELGSAVAASTPADPNAANPPGAQQTSTNVSGDGGSAAATSGSVDNAETVAGAAAAGGYNAPDAGTATAATENELPPATGQHPDDAGTVQPDLGAVDDANLNDAGDRIETQEGREEAGAFTGTGNQDAMRTSGTPGSTDPNAADQRTSGDESAVDDAA